MPGKFVSKEFPDFQDLNHVWCWDIDDHGKFKNIELGNLIAGDTDSGYFRVPDSIADLPMEEIVGIADDIVSRVDQRFPEFLKVAFNCPEDRIRSVRTEREVISDKSFFVTKKRYAMHIINDEGKVVDKTKIMGLEVKKSDTSKALKRFLRIVIDMIVDGSTRKEVLKAKKEFREEFYTLPINEIGPAMPAKKLTQYENEYRMSQSFNGFPYHYRAALFYNSQCGKLDKPIYQGEKFHVCNIKSMDSKYIAMPVTLNREPEFFNNFQIDYDTMWRKVEKKFNNYMESLGWDMAGQAKKQAASLFGIGK